MASASDKMLFTSWEVFLSFLECLGQSSLLFYAFLVLFALTRMLLPKESFAEELTKKLRNEVTEEMKITMNKDLRKKLGAELRDESQKIFKGKGAELEDKLVVELEKVKAQIEEAYGRALDEMMNPPDMEKIKRDVTREVKDKVSKDIGGIVDGMERRRRAARQQDVEANIQAIKDHIAQEVRDQIRDEIGVLRDGFGWYMQQLGLRLRANEVVILELLDLQGD